MCAKAMRLKQAPAEAPADAVGQFFVDRYGSTEALKNTLAMYSETGRMDPKGAEAVLAVFSLSSPDVAKANIDLSKTYTNTYVDAANKKMGMK